SRAFPDHSNLLLTAGLTKFPAAASETSSSFVSCVLHRLTAPRLWREATARLHDRFGHRRYQTPLV
ncbi:MAG TPA: hypothetical protein VFQ90_09200, partial [Stellaceae bacterium]|nr:hypothetical protein [Stellaceae bacterium]